MEQKHGGRVKYSIQAHYMQKLKKPPSISTYFRKIPK